MEVVCSSLPKDQVITPYEFEIESGEQDDPVDQQQSEQQGEGISILIAPYQYFFHRRKPAFPRLTRLSLVQVSRFQGRNPNLSSQLHFSLLIVHD
ncbi:MAG: hypothetical protein IPN95_09765 [Bacteroidetes bacterium]|nr:hypothetical protein [Bacteroidota bacterium]